MVFRRYRTIEYAVLCLIATIGVIAIVGNILTRAYHHYVGMTYPPYRWRLTIVVDTPSGLKSFSGVFENQDTVLYSSVPFGGGRAVCVRGDAIPMKLDTRSIVYAMPWNATNPDWAKYAPEAVLPEPMSDPVYLGNTLPNLRGSAEIERSRMGVPYKNGWPSFVRIPGRLDGSVLPVIDPDHIAPGVRVRRIFVTMTTDPISRPLRANITSIRGMIPNADADYSTEFFSLPFPPC